MLVECHGQSESDSYSSVISGDANAINARDYAKRAVSSVSIMPY